MKQKINSLMMVTILGVVMHSSPASASDIFSDIGKALEEGITSDGNFVNESSAKIIEGHKRGVITGGSYVARYGISPKPKIITFSPPSISAGCGGISVNGGSLSYISGDQLLNYVKNLAANAKGYFFKLALNAACPSCMTVVNSIEKAFNKLNGIMSNSCDAAKSLLDNPVINTAMNFTRETVGAMTTEVASGLSSGIEDIAGLSSKGGQVEAASELGKPEIVNRNYVWKALNDAEFDTWFGYSAATAVGEGMMDGSELGMALYGTVIKRKSAPSSGAKTSTGEEDTSTEEKAVSLIFQPLINDMSLFLFGEEGSDGTGSMSPDGMIKIKYYDCDTDNGAVDNMGVTKCLFMDIRDAEIKSVRKNISDFLKSISAKYDDRHATLTIDEMLFMAHMPPFISSKLKKLSFQKGAVEAFITKYTDQIAYNYAIDYLAKLSAAVSNAVSGQSESASLAQLVKARRAEITSLLLKAETKMVKGNTEHMAMISDYLARIKLIQEDLKKQATKLPQVSPSYDPTKHQGGQ